MSSVITITTQPPDDPGIPTPTFYSGYAGDLIAAIEAIVAILPKFAVAEGVDAKQARRLLNVPDSFCNTAIAALEQLPAIDGTKRFDADNARNVLQFLEAFRPMEAKLDAAMRQLKHALHAMKSSVAADSLEVYRMTQALANDGRNQAAVALAVALKRDLGRKTGSRADRGKRKAEKLKVLVAQVLAGKSVDEVLGLKEVTTA